MISTVAGCKNRGIAGTAKLVTTMPLSQSRPRFNRQLRIGYGPMPTTIKSTLKQLPRHTGLSRYAIASRRWICMLQRRYYTVHAVFTFKICRYTRRNHAIHHTISHFYHGN